MAGLFAKTTPLLGRFFAHTLTFPVVRPPTASWVGLMVRNYRSYPTLLRRSAIRSTRKGPTKICLRCGASIPLAACPCPNCSGLVALDPDGTLSHFAILGYTSPEFQRCCSKWEKGMADEIRKLGGRALRLDADEVVALGNERLAALQPGRYKSLLDPEEEKRLLDQIRWRILEAVRVLSDETARQHYIADIYCRTSRYLPFGRGKTIKPIERTEERLKATTNPLTVLSIKRDNDKKIRLTQTMIEQALSAEFPDGHGAKRFIYDLELYKRVDTAVRATKLLAV